METPAVEEVLREFTDSAPRDLVEHFERGEFTSVLELEINVLPLAEACEYSRLLSSLGTFSTISPFALEDAYDSNPHCYALSGVLQGMVVHMVHDGEHYVRCVSLAGFMDLVVKAAQGGTKLGDIPRERVTHPDRKTLRTELTRLARVDDEDAEYMLCLLIPLLSDDSAAVLASVSRHRSMFVRQAVAIHAERCPNASLEPIIETLKVDRHHQVKVAAERALTAIRRLNT